MNWWTLHEECTVLVTDDLRYVPDDIRRQADVIFVNGQVAKNRYDVHR